MKIISISIFFLLHGLCAWGQEIQSELSLINPPALVKEGDVIEGVLKVWPLENADLNEFKKLESQTLDKVFYVTEVENIELSANNADVIEVKLLFIVKRAPGPTIDQVMYKGRVVNFTPPVFNLAPAENDQEDYYVLNQGVLYSNFGKILIGVLSLFVLVLLVAKRNSIAKFIKKLKTDPVAIARKKYNAKFINAKIREDYEEVYAERKDWIDFIGEVSPPYHDFFKTMEQYQYKKTWAEEELNEVRTSFEIIQGSFK